MRSVPVFVFEEGYIRPNYVTFESGGANGFDAAPLAGPAANPARAPLPEPRPVKAPFAAGAHAMTLLPGRTAAS